MLTVEEVCEVSGLEPQTLRNWISRGLITPAQGGGVGRGKGHRFSVMQTVGLVVAERVRASEQGCVLSYVGKVVEAFAATTEKKLLQLFHQGRTHFVCSYHGKPVLQGPSQGPTYDWVDVQATHKEVTQKVAEIERRLKDQTGGRLWGLAGTSKQEG
jgi:DNA-binding transcriptional MerR regulator